MSIDDAAQSLEELLRPKFGFEPRKQYNQKRQYNKDQKGERFRCFAPTRPETYQRTDETPNKFGAIWTGRPEWGARNVRAGSARGVQLTAR